MNLSQNLVPIWVTYLSQDLVTKMSQKMVTNSVSHQIWWQICHHIWWQIQWVTKFGDKFFTKLGEKFGDHQIWWQICHQICHQIPWGSYMISDGGSTAKHSKAIFKWVDWIVIRAPCSADVAIEMSQKCGTHRQPASREDNGQKESGKSQKSFPGLVWFSQYRVIQRDCHK